mgnify:CR=1 FL=1
MISLHDIKDGLIIFALVGYLGWGLFKRVREDFRKEFLHRYQYSVPFIGGYFISVTASLGLIFSFYYFIDYSLWITLLVFLGGALMIYGRGALAKYEYKEERSKCSLGMQKICLGTLSSFSLYLF